MQRSREMTEKLEREQEKLIANKNKPYDLVESLLKKREKDQKKSEAAVKLKEFNCQELVDANKEKMISAKQARKALNEKYKDNAKKIIEIEKEKEHQIKFVKDQFQDELEKRKEIMSLRKLDQEENY